MKRLLLLLTLLLTLTTAVHAQESGLTDQRFARLQRGINLPFWFWYAPANVDARFADEDFQLIHDLGFTFVRVPIDLGYVFDESSPDLLNHDNLKHVDSGFDRLLEHDLAIIVDLHSTSIADSNASNYSGALEDPEFVDLFIRFWKSFAAHLKDRDPEMVFFGPMNEPVFEDDPSAWLPIQERLLTAIREVAPEHTLIATGALWSSRETLLEIEPYADPNIVYDFHFYEPFVFTHQGATWTWDAVAVMRNVPYPSNPENVAPLLDGLPDESRQALEYYGQELWDGERINAEIARVAEWAKANNVRLICTEFGVLGDFAPPADRVQWTLDIRTAFEEYGIGWSMWEYDSSFGLVTRSGSRRILDQDLANALGLNVIAPG